MKPAIFIDAFISNNESKKHLNYNVNNFIKNNHDVFIISNKISSFDNFDNIKYFEFDSRNRLLKEYNKYILRSKIHWHFKNWSDKKIIGSTLIHGFTNWTILYNIKKICKVLKSFGYTHFIRSEYDVLYKNYDLMNTIFKDFGKTENSKNGMFLRGDWGVVTNFCLLSVNFIDNLLPEFETEQDYENFLIKIYGNSISTVFEELIFDLVKNSIEFLDTNSTNQYIENINMCGSQDESLYRHYITHKNVVFFPVNNNEQFYIENKSNDDCYVEITNNGNYSILKIESKTWRIFNVKNHVKIKTSFMKSDEFRYFDLNIPYSFNITSL